MSDDTSNASRPVAKFGPARGTPLDELMVEQLENLARHLVRDLLAAPNGQYADSDERQLADIRTELSKRSHVRAKGSG